jgi:hypothetical protein
MSGAWQGASALLKNLLKTHSKNVKVQRKAAESLQKTGEGVFDAQSNPHRAEHHHTEAQRGCQRQCWVAQAQKQPCAGGDLEEAGDYPQFGQLIAHKLCFHPFEGEATDAVTRKAKCGENLGGFDKIVH